MADVIGKGKAHVSKVDAILTDSHLQSSLLIGLKVCPTMNAIVSKLEYAGGVWEGNAKSVKRPGPVHTTATKHVLGCSNTTSNTQEQDNN